MPPPILNGSKIWLDNSVVGLKSFKQPSSLNHFSFLTTSDHLALMDLYRVSGKWRINSSVRYVRGFRESQKDNETILYDVDYEKNVIL